MRRGFAGRSETRGDSADLIPGLGERTRGDSADLIPGLGGGGGSGSGLGGGDAGFVGLGEPVVEAVEALGDGGAGGPAGEGGETAGVGDVVALVGGSPILKDALGRAAEDLLHHGQEFEEADGVL